MSMIGRYHYSLLISPLHLISVLMSLLNHELLYAIYRGLSLTSKGINTSAIFTDIPKT